MLYSTFELYVRTYYVDAAGDAWEIDEIHGFQIDLTNAEPKNTLVLAVADTTDAFTMANGSKTPTVSTHGDITTLSVSYVQARGYDANRIFDLKIPKDPIHYINEGFVPLSSHPDINSYGYQYELHFDVYWRQIKVTRI